MMHASQQLQGLVQPVQGMGSHGSVQWGITTGARDEPMNARPLPAGAGAAAAGSVHGMNACTIPSSS